CPRRPSWSAGRTCLGSSSVRRPAIPVDSAGVPERARALPRSHSHGVRPVVAAGPSHFGDEHRPWLEMLRAIGASPHGLRLPDGAELSSIFARLAIDQADAAEIIAGWPTPTKDPDIWWLLERPYHALVSDLGGIEPLRWPNLPPAFGTTGRFFYVYLFLAAHGSCFRRIFPKPPGESACATHGSSTISSRSTSTRAPTSFASSDAFRSSATAPTVTRPFCDSCSSGSRRTSTSSRREPRWSGR